jgi:ADP-ribose pyrophosphatase YjhB (NUDIX family)
MVTLTKRWAMRVAYQVLRVYWYIARPDTYSVKCLLVAENEVLLVRHTYGDRSRWWLPGGRIKRGEAPPAAARRELEEELGVGPPLRAIATWSERKQATTTYYCFTADVAAPNLTVNAGEIAEARWFPRDGLPPQREPLVSALLCGKGGPRLSLAEANGERPPGRPAP